jgi:putative zinc finger/helix-turn-helix YgiT family protein
MHFPVNGEEVSVRGIPHLRCPNCDESLLSLEEVRLFRETAFGIYRTKYGLLGPDEIRRLRERLQLTQAAMAKLLRLGGNTISRWEAGRKVQTAAMDVLLRILRDLPGSLEYLRKRAA